MFVIIDYCNMLVLFVLSSWFIVLLHEGLVIRFALIPRFSVALGLLQPGALKILGILTILDTFAILDMHNIPDILGSLIVICCRWISLPFPLAKQRQLIAKKASYTAQATQHKTKQCGNKHFKEKQNKSQ